MTGQRFGRLTVLELAEPYITPGGKKSRRWRCRCDCGNEIIVPQNVLVSKTGTRSCGCARRERTRAAAQDMMGQRFGRLTVLAPADLPKARANGLRMGWRCRCDCGREIITTRNDLLSGRKLSCGCLRAEAATQRVAVDVGHYAGTTISAIRADRHCIGDLAVSAEKGEFNIIIADWALTLWGGRFFVLGAQKIAD